MKTEPLRIATTTLNYIHNGTGKEIIFLHGALADYRMWIKVMETFPSGYKTIAYTQHFFGKESEGVKTNGSFGVEQHTDDLAEFIKYTCTTKPHIIAWSYAGHVVLNLAVKYPDLAGSLFIYETGVPVYLPDKSSEDKFGKDVAEMFGPLFQLSDDELNGITGTAMLIDASGNRKGYFADLDKTSREIIIDNKHTLVKQLNQIPPPVITPEQLGNITIPVCLCRGEKTRELFALATDNAAQCIPSATHKIIPGKNHMWPMEEPENFAKEVFRFTKSL